MPRQVFSGCTCTNVYQAKNCKRVDKGHYCICNKDHRSCRAENHDCVCCHPFMICQSTNHTCICLRNNGNECKSDEHHSSGK
jgi:hypothetical protein